MLILGLLFVLWEFHSWFSFVLLGSLDRVVSVGCLGGYASEIQVCPLRVSARNFFEALEADTKKCR